MDTFKTGMGTLEEIRQATRFHPKHEQISYSERAMALQGFLKKWQSRVKVQLNKKGTRYEITGDNRVPNAEFERVTKVLGVISKPFLTQWAVNQTVEAYKKGEADPKRAAENIANTSAEFGTLAHRIIEILTTGFQTSDGKYVGVSLNTVLGFLSGFQFTPTGRMRSHSHLGLDSSIQGKDLKDFKDIFMAIYKQGTANEKLFEMRRVLICWKEFIDDYGLEIVGTEVGVYCPYPEYIGDHWGFAGTIDAIAISKRPEDGIFLIDYKTGNSTYPEHGLQMTAYKRAFIYSGLAHLFDVVDRPIHSVVLRLDKKGNPPRAEINVVQDDEVLHKALEGAIAIRNWQSYRSKWDRKGWGVFFDEESHKIVLPTGRNNHEQ